MDLELCSMTAQRLCLAAMNVSLHMYFVLCVVPSMRH
jgi:hypothetical protein